VKLRDLVAEPWLVAQETYRALVYAAANGAPVKAAKAAARLPNPTQALQSLAAAGADPEAFLWLLTAEEDEGDLEVRDGVAIIPVQGFLTAWSYWRGDRASYQWIGDAVSESVRRADVRAVVLDVDSAGGQVKGCDEVAAAIYEARRDLPITAVVRGEASSAAYWIASAAERVVSGRSSLMGSIGVVMTFLDFSKRDEAIGIEEIEVVSSQSPYKRPDPKDGEGRARIQTTVDELAAIFVADVARNRGVSIETVAQDFGEGWVLVGDAAVAAGMADETGTFDEVVERFANDGSGATQRRGTQGGNPMKTVNVSAITVDWLAENLPDMVQSIRDEGAAAERKGHDEALAKARDEGMQAGRDEGRAEGATAEQDRCKGIDEALAGTGFESLAADLKANPEASRTTALEALADAQRTARKTWTGAREKDESELGALEPGNPDQPAATRSDRIVANAKKAGISPAEKGKE